MSLVCRDWSTNLTCIMMGDEYGGPDPFARNSVFSKIEPNILRILHKFGSTPESEIVETLVNDIDEHEMNVCRQMFFEESIKN